MRFCVAHAGDKVFWFGPEGQLLYVNESACAGLGYTGAELLKLNISDLAPDYDSGVWKSHWEELKARRTMTFESRYRSKAGHFFPIKVSANYVRVGAQEFNFAFSRDITERKQSEARFRWLVDSSAQGVMFWNTNGEITGANNLPEPGGIQPRRPGGRAHEMDGDDAARTRQPRPAGNGGGQAEGILRSIRKGIYAEGRLARRRAGGRVGVPGSAR